MYETLLTFEGDDVTKPGVGDLAASYVLSPDAKTLTLTLDQGRVFSDGTPITADDVVFSLQRVIGMKGNPSFLLDGVTVTKKDDKHGGADQRDAQPRPAVHPAQPGAAASSTPRSSRRTAAPPTRRTPPRSTSTAPPPAPARTCSKSLNVASQVVLTANPKYNGPDKPAYDTVVIRNVKAATQKLNVQRGDAQVALDLSGDQVKGLDTGKVTVTSGPSANVIFLLLNQDAAVSPTTSNPQFV